MPAPRRNPELHYKPHCRTCRTKWSGLAVCHCGGCHETFTSLSGFDAHRFNDDCARISENGGGTNSRLIRPDGKQLPLLRSPENLWHFPGRIDLPKAEGLILL